MQIELLQNKKGLYEIWADKDCIIEIRRGATESQAAYSERSERQFDAYVEQMRSIQSSTPKKIKSATI
jgi:ribosomal protein S4